MVIDLDERFYIKPEGGMLLVSPADETPVAPCDVQPEEIDVAHAVARYEEVTGRTVRRISHRWAGLRSFVADHAPGGRPRSGRARFRLAGRPGRRRHHDRTGPGADRRGPDHRRLPRRRTWASIRHRWALARLRR